MQLRFILGSSLMGDLSNLDEVILCLRSKEGKTLIGICWTGRVLIM